MTIKDRNDEGAAIRATVQTYIDGFLGTDAALLRAAFDGDAKLIATQDGAIEGMPVAQWFEKVEQRRQTGNLVASATYAIKSIDQSGDAAVARVELDFAEYSFTDFLSLLKGANGWKIANKIYTVSQA